MHSLTHAAQAGFAMTENQNPEQQARDRIDAQLRAAGWAVQKKIDFSAGVGQLVCHNTDSIFVKLPNGGKTGKEALKASIATCVEASEKFKALLKPPHDLEYEVSTCFLRQ